MHKLFSKCIFLIRFVLYFSSCKQWLNNCRRQDLESEPLEQLHKLYRLCAKHFEPSMISHQVRCRCIACKCIREEGNVAISFTDLFTAKTKTLVYFCSLNYQFIMYTCNKCCAIWAKFYPDRLNMEIEQNTPPIDHRQVLQQQKNNSCNWWTREAQRRTTQDI